MSKTAELKIEELLDATEAEYSKCWEILSAIKNRAIDESFAERVLSFQTILANALFKLEKKYLIIAEEKRAIIRKKQRLKPDWWKRRLAALAKHQKAIEEVMCIGKCIGDAFAWYFYQQDQDKLAEHLRHNRSLHVPPGIGGQGELELVRRVPKLDRFLVLYHGITNILRIGDVSLIDLETARVRAVGDIKTKQVAEDRITVSIYFVGSIQREHFDVQVPIQDEEPLRADLPDKMKPRLSRQLDAVEKMFRGSQDRTKENEHIMAHHHAKALERLILDSKCTKAIAKKVDEGLVIGVIKRRRQRFSRKFLVRTDYHKVAFSEIVSETVKTHKKERNEVITTTALLYETDAKATFLPGSIPLFWWPIDISALRRLYFQDIVVLTIFNHAHIVDAMAKLGFSITYPDSNGRSMKVTKIDGKRRMELQRFDYFLSLVQCYLFSEKAVVDLIKNVLSGIESQDIERDTKIQLDIVQRSIV